MRKPNRLSEDSLDIIRADLNSVTLSILAEMFGGPDQPFDPKKKTIPTWKKFHAALDAGTIPEWMWVQAEERAQTSEEYKQLAADNIQYLLEHIECLENELAELKGKRELNKNE